MFKIILNVKMTFRINYIEDCKLVNTSCLILFFSYKIIDNMEIFRSENITTYDWWYITIQVYKKTQPLFICIYTTVKCIFLLSNNNLFI